MKPFKNIAKPHHAVTLFKGSYGEDANPVHAYVAEKLFVQVDIVTFAYPKDSLMRKTLDALIGTAVLEYRKYVGARLGTED